MLNTGYIGCNSRDIPDLFGSIEEFQSLIKQINNLPDPLEESRYISRFYGPQSLDIEQVDFQKERLFYTRENALRIDKIRTYIQEKFQGPEMVQQKSLLIAMLLYQCATHTNTSGVFKAYHKGFGGHNGDAMKRIISPIELEMPHLINSDYPAHIFKEDANQLVRMDALKNLDIAYLDPPYNQHQYGSNYHMLNSIALWDKIPHPLELNERGILCEKAAIRKDWIKTRSKYCYQESAIASFSDLLENLDARHLLISYSTDGIIPFDIMKDLCVKQGKISLVTNEYTKYRGGKQSNGRLNSNIEFIITVDREKSSSSASVKRVDALISRKKILLLLKQKYSHEKLTIHCSSIEKDFLSFDIGKREFFFTSKDHFEISPRDGLDDLSLEEMDVLYGKLSRCVCLTKEEELEQIYQKIIDKNLNSDFYMKQIPLTLKKLAHKKNKERFYLWLKKINRLKEGHSALYSTIDKKVENLLTLAEKRFNS